MSERDGQGDRLVETVRRFIDARALIPPRAGVVVGVSGGADSVGLLAVLRELSGEEGRGWNLTVAHLHHGLRRGADADAEFVADLARRWELPCVVERCDVGAEARRTGRGTEETGRDLRLAFLCETACKVGAGCVALGHHADDNVETVLHRIVRGTHIRGMGGIPAMRKEEGTHVRLVRPLLQSRRQDIESFCLARRLPWRTDPTNADVTFRRNFIRHELLPLLREKLNPRVDEALLRLAAAGREVEDFLRGEAAAALGEAERGSDAGTLALDRTSMGRRPPVVRKAAMRLALEKVGAPLGGMSAERFDELSTLFDPEGPAGVSLGGGYVARREGGCVIVAPGRDRTAPPDGDALTLPCPGEVDLGDGRKVLCETHPFDEQLFASHCRHHPPGVELIDADQILPPLSCRPRRDGDVFRPLGCAGRQSVSDFLTNLKVPRPRRESARCICDELGIVYLVPLRIDQRVRVTSRTRRVLRIAACGFDA